MDEPVRANRTGRKLFILGVVLVVVIVGWTGGWFWLRGEVARRMDDQIARLSQRGIVVTCPERTIGGWPFRMDVDCSNPSFTQSGRLTSGSVKHLRITALVYQPTLVLAELDGPLSVTGPNGESVNGTWSELQASAGFSLSSTLKPQRLSVVVDNLAAGVAKPGGQETKLVTAHGEFHGRPASDSAGGGGDFDLAVSLAAATVSVADRVVGPEGMDISVDSVARNVPLAPDPSGMPPLKVWADNGGKIDIRSARVALGGFSVNGQGSLMAKDDGLLSGQLKLIASGINALTSPAGMAMKGRAELVGLALAFATIGKPVTENGTTGRSLDLTIDEGRIKIGPTAFGHLPPLF